MRTIRLKKEETCLVVSDTHIGNGVRTLPKLLKLLDRYDFVVFNGDILELFIHRFKRISTGLAAPLFDWMWNNQDKFIYVVGNHDESMWDLEDFDKPFFDLYTTVRVVQDGSEFVVTHGHQFDRETRRTTWRVKFLYFLEFVSNILFRVNWQHAIFKEKKFFFPYADRQRRVKLPEVRANARMHAEASGIKCLIHGHTHFPADKVYNKGTRYETRVIDQGSFQIGVSYVEIHEGKADLRLVE